ncbi:multidrug transporter [Emericellopsis cladophorae]|uniref:Multidrug transporter n=1 Tax=Emericellopsis cladophorae TaxID=2686198 RepID=A0A9Q0BB17_9HYPO|nr:multidrug transporter [Emericellopsis cladophorae]KAI6778807.1 multidrug transporter [Emericellopsis cladophorae]
MLDGKPKDKLMIPNWLLGWASGDDKRKSKTNPKTCEHRIAPSLEPCDLCAAEATRARKYRWKIILGLVFPFALQALDSTIIASALPWIAHDFGRFSQLNWIVSAFNLTSAAFIPFWAQMCDVFGRNATINGSIILMLLGSALCTGAPTSAFPMLLLGRGFQGLAAAGLNVVVQTILADRVSLKEAASNWSIFAFVGGTAYGLGPVIGGYLTNANWRWCFAINLPMGVVALVTVYFLLRKELLGAQPIPELDETVETGRRTKFGARLKTVDFGGQALFLVGFGLIILGLTRGGATYPWASAAVVVPMVFGTLLTGVFVYWEYLMAPGKLLSQRFPTQKPMIPWNIITTKDIMLVFFTETTSGVAMYAVLYFCNIYFISVKDFRPDEAGVQLLFFIPGLSGGVIICSFLCNSWPRMTWPPIFLGTLVEAVGLGMLSWACYNEKPSIIFGMMALVGVGSGLRYMSGPLHGVGYFRQHRAVIAGTMALAHPFGGTLGLTVMTTVFNNLSGLEYDPGFEETSTSDPRMNDELRENAKMGVVWAFVAVTPFLVLAWIATFLLGNVILGDGNGPDEEGLHNTVIRDPYIVKLLRGQGRPAQPERDVRLRSWEVLGSSHSTPVPAD